MCMFYKGLRRKQKGGGEFKDLLKEGSGAFLSHNYRKAAECFKSARERVGKLTDFDIDDRQYNIIKYAHCAALVSSDSYDEIVKALQMLGEMHTYEFTIPALYIQTAKAYCKLNRINNATVSWVPGHQGVSGNEKANLAQRPT
ncbi:hypothetical protein J6590_048065 [Homalodisca vitripennis]|nr:hypothetical protein J6590_048065 [Homalodisca vitripennis]